MHIYFLTCEYVVLTCGLCMQVQPAVKDAASRAEPAAKDVTQNYIRPAGDYVADNAVPLTQEIGARTRFLPAVPWKKRERLLIFHTIIKYVCIC